MGHPPLNPLLTKYADILTSYIVRESSTQDRCKDHQDKSIHQERLLSLLEENPLDEISVKDICDHISVNRTTFYTHFKNIGEVLDEALDGFLNDEEPSIRTYRCNISCKD